MAHSSGSNEATSSDFVSQGTTKPEDHDYQDLSDEGTSLESAPTPRTEVLVLVAEETYRCSSIISISSTDMLKC